MGPEATKRRVVRSTEGWPTKGDVKKTRLSKALLLLVSPPLRIGRVLCEMTIVVGGSILPPNRTAFAQRALCAVDSCSNMGPLILRGAAESRARLHEFMHKPFAFVVRKLWVAQAPETSSNNEITLIRRPRVLFRIRHPLFQNSPLLFTTDIESRCVTFTRLRRVRPQSSS